METERGRKLTEGRELLILTRLSERKPQKYILAELKYAIAKGTLSKWIKRWISDEMIFPLSKTYPKVYTVTYKGRQRLKYLQS